MRKAMIAVSMLAIATMACAAGPGTSSGRYEGNGRAFAFTHAVALRVDDAEKVNFTGPGLRVLLSDEDVGVEAIEGHALPPAHALAGAGKLHGLMLAFSPDKPDEMNITVLDDRKDIAGFASISLVDGAGLWQRLEVGDGRVVGELKPTDGLAFRFDVPIVEDPVREDIRGAAARTHPLVTMLRQEMQARARDDPATANGLSSSWRQAEMAAVPAADLSVLRARMMPWAIADIARIDRVVVRGNVATGLTPDGTGYSLRREAGAWKVE